MVVGGGGGEGGAWGARVTHIMGAGGERGGGEESNPVSLQSRCLN